MSEQKRKEAVYLKVRKKFPAVTDSREIDRLAIQLERRRTTWLSVLYLWLSILCVFLWCLDIPLDSLGGFCIVFFIVTSFEYYRTVLNSAKIKVHYSGGAQAPFEGELTYNKICADCKAAGSQEFRLVKAVLCDKDDRDNSSVSFTFHKYNLFFRLEDSVFTVGFRVKRRVYLTAPLDAEYILVLSSAENVLGAYMASSWEISPELYEKCSFSAAMHNSTLQKSTAIPVTAKVTNKDVVLNIILLAAHLFPFISTANIIILYLPVTTYLATKSAIKNINALSLMAIIFGWASIVSCTLYLFFQV